MAVPTAPTFSVAALVAAHTALANLIDGGLAGGFLRIRTSADVLLAEVPLSYPCGTVSGTTGRLTITASGRDESANASGTAAYGELVDSTGAVHLALPVEQGTAAVTGKLVLNTLAFIAGGPVEAVSITIG